MQRRVFGLALSLVLKLQFLILLVCVGLCLQPSSCGQISQPPPIQARQPKVGRTLGACAGFAVNGSSAAARYDDQNLSLDIAELSGQEFHLTVALRLAPSRLPPNADESSLRTCRIFFDEEGGLVAVGISPYGGPLQVAVADFKAFTWLGHFVVEAAISSGQLWGFLYGTKSLLVTEQLSLNTDEGPLFGSFLFDTAGKKLSTAPTTTWRTIGPFIADAIHDRLWTLPCTWYSAQLSDQPLCPISSTSLTENDASGTAVYNPKGHTSKRVELWMVPHAITAPNPNTVLLGETVVGVDTIWRVDMRTEMMERLVVPRRAHFPNEDQEFVATLSPDCQIAAVSFEQFTANFPWLTEGTHWTGSHIAIVQVRPLQTLGIFPRGRAAHISAFAVDHRDGKVILLVFSSGRWERYEFSDQPR
jgi:hypothetical protein